MDEAVEDRIRELIKGNPELLIQTLRREEGILAAKLGLDSGTVDVHKVLKEDPELQKEFESVIEKFHQTQVRNEEDTDDLYDAEEHNSKTIEALEHKGQEEVVPPENFSHIVGEIYRSSFPRLENFSFLRDRIRLKSILVLIPEDYPQENLEFMEQAGIKLFQVGMSGNKEPFVNIPSDLLTKALEVAINPANHPILIHCNRGKHRTGCLVGCIRKLQNWSLTMIFDEYRRFAFPKARALDQQFIEMYDDKEIIEKATQKKWLPINW